MAYTPNNPNGQVVMASSAPVVLASDQTAISVTGTFFQATQPVSGTFWQTTQPVSLISVPSHAVTNAGTFAVQAALDAGVNLLGRVSASNETSTVYNGTTALTPRFAFANIAASTTDGNIVTTVAGKKIRVLQILAVAGATATNLTFNSKPAGAGTAISPLMANGVNGGEVLPYSPVGWFETVSGEGLTVTTESGATTGILVCYVEV